MEQNRTAVVVDHDPNALTTVASYLSQQGFQVAVAARWTEAILQIQEKRPDIVLLDLHMPTVHGDALLEFMRELDRDLPVVIVSSGIEADEMERLGRLGASGFIRKPFESDDLLLVIEQVMAERAAAQENVASADVTLQQDIEKAPSPSPAPSALPLFTGQVEASPQPLLSHVSPGAGIETLQERPIAGISPAPAPTRKRRVRKRRGKKGRRVRNYVLTFILCLLIAGVLWIAREKLSAGFFGIGFTKSASEKQVE